jgi:hypothetical protein
VAGDVVDADDPLRRVAQVRDQWRRDQRTTPGLVVGPVDDVDDGPSALSAPAVGRIHLRPDHASATRTGTATRAGTARRPARALDEHVRACHVGRPLLLERLVVLVEHHH